MQNGDEKEPLEATTSSPEKLKKTENDTSSIPATIPTIITTGTVINGGAGGVADKSPDKSPDNQLLEVRDQEPSKTNTDRNIASPVPNGLLLSEPETVRLSEDKMDIDLKHSASDNGNDIEMKGSSADESTENTSELESSEDSDESSTEGSDEDMRDSDVPNRTDRANSVPPASIQPTSPPKLSPHNTNPERNERGSQERQSPQGTDMTSIVSTEPENTDASVEQSKV